MQIRVQRKAQQAFTILSVLFLMGAAANAATATGGTVVTNDNYVIHTFTNSGTFEVSGGTLSCDVLVVGGGGGGGGMVGGGGGGGGGLVHTTGFAVPVGSYTVTVGQGGPGMTANYGAGSKGENSVFSTLSAEGGGGGGAWGENAGDGGCGGGGRGASGGVGDYPGGSGVPGQGFDGGIGKYTGPNGHIGGGGGGSGEPGGDATASAPGDGGDGLACAISGTIEWYAGGGGGNRYSAGSGAGGRGGGGRGSGSGFPADHGAPNTGGGGGGSGSGTTYSRGGGTGGSGIVVVRYVVNPSLPPSGGAITTDGADTIHTFTTSGVFHVYQGSTICDVLVVGGGGGGGAVAGGGGGGGGGLIYTNGMPVPAGSYVVIVGEGGPGMVGNYGAGAKGQDSVFRNLIAEGGGGGGCWTEDAGSGGCGGGGRGASMGVGDYPGGTGVAGQGLDGGIGKYTGPNGHIGGGGGGAGEPGGDATPSAPGDGGDGLPISISGTETYYAGGGGGNRYSAGSGAGGLGGGGRGSSSSGGFGADPGTPNTGGGGGGDGSAFAFPGGGAGGSGIVIVRVPSPEGMLIAVRGGQQAAPPDEATQEVIDQWRALFPDEPYICWRKESPWDGLDRLQLPPAGVELLQQISLDMGRNEYESTSFVLTNPSYSSIEFEITNAPISILTTLRKTVWVTVDDGSQVNDALSLLDSGRVVIPAGQSREIWITLHGNQAAPGQYNQTINILSQGLAPRVVDIIVEVHDVSLPESMPLAVFYFEEIVPPWPTPEWVNAYMNDLRIHHVNHAFWHPEPLPRLAVDPGGQLITDYTQFDQTLDAYMTLAPDRFMFFWHTGAYLEPAANGRPEFMTPEWKLLFHEWLTGWVAHMAGRGIGYDGFIMHPYDEEGGTNAQATIKLIKEVDPEIMVLFNGALGRTPQEIEEDIAPYIDIWMPHLYRYLDAGGVNGCIYQTISLDPDTPYTLSFYGKNGSVSIYYDLVFDGSSGRYADLLDAADWRQATHSFTTAPDTTQVRIRFFPMVGNETILIDDVVLGSGSGSNMVVNGDMEAGSPPDSWSTSSAEVVANTTDPHSGGQCAEVTNIPLQDDPAKAAAKQFLGTAAGKLLWTYANPVGTGPTRASPYHAYRLPVWRAWKEGMTGFSIWKYEAGRWDSSGQGNNWGVVYRSDAADCPAEVSRQELVVPGKRWEATREGVEDYAYLYLLKTAISGSSLPPGSTVLEEAQSTLAYWTEEVLDQADNDEVEVADEAKTEIMEAILALTPGPG